jgi:hypothetical protein
MIWESIRSHSSFVLQREKDTPEPHLGPPHQSQRMHVQAQNLAGEKLHSLQIAQKSLKQPSMRCPTDRTAMQICSSEKCNTSNTEHPPECFGKVFVLTLPSSFIEKKTRQNPIAQTLFGELEKGIVLNAGFVQRSVASTVRPAEKYRFHIGLLKLFTHLLMRHMAPESMPSNDIHPVQQSGCQENKAP